MSQSNSEIGSLEHDLHTIFADYRASPVHTVFVPDKEIEEQLDNFCAESSFHEAREPLVLIGPSGCGKSASIANWLAQRKRVGARRSRLSSLNSQEEFVFYHATGCSRQSTFVGHMLHRLLRELADHFEIDRDVSQSEDKLTWDLSSFLELAVQKGPVLLVIDGVGRLRNEEGNAQLNWLPLRFPGNCRLILAITDMRDVHASPLSPSGGMSASQDSESKTSASAEVHEVADKTSLDQHRRVRVLLELQRRNWRNVFMSATLGSRRRADLAALFLAAVADKPPSTVFQLTSSDQPPDEPLPGLSLFPSQLEAVLGSSGNALFLSVVLRTLSFAAAKGFDLQRLLDEMTRSATSKELLGHVLDALENGQPMPDNDTVSQRTASAEALGGFPALRDAHPLYQLVRSKSAGATGEARALDAPSNGEWSSLEAAEVLLSGATESAEAAASSLVDEAIGDDAAPATAAPKPPKAPKTPKPPVVLGAGSRVEALYDGGEEWFSGLVSEVNDDGSFVIEYDDGDVEYQVEATMVRPLVRPEGAPSDGEEDEEDYGDDFSESNGVETSEGESAGAATNQEEGQKDAAEEQAKEEEKDEDEDEVYGDDDYEVDDYGDEFDDEEGSEKRPKTPKSAKKTPTSPAAKVVAANNKPERQGSMSEVDLKKMHAELEVRRKAEEARRSEEEEKIKVAAASSAKAAAEVEATRNEAKAAEVASTRHLVPLCQRGGTAVEGLDHMLGYALSLLFVARHGLREHELWALLGQLKFEDDQKRTRGVTASEEAEEELLKIVVRSKSKLMGIFRDMDMNHDGTINLHEFRRGMRGLDVGMNDMQLELIVSRVIAACQAKAEAIGEEHDSCGALSYGLLFGIFDDRLAEIQAKRSLATGLQANKPLPVSTTSALDALLNDMDDGMAGGADSVGPAMEASLMAAFDTLGLLRFPEQQVIVLPLQSEALRDMVYFRYVGSNEKREYWHLRLVKYFTRSGPSLRRSEELPWHLRHVRRWAALMGCLSELKTFELMFGHPKLRVELLEYWQVLTLGPLFLTDTMEQQHRKAADAAHDELKSDASQDKQVLPYEASMRLCELDKAAALGLTENRTRQHRLEGQVAPFDVVLEYNKTVEAWVSTGKPSTKRLAHVLYKVGSFLVEFSDVLAAAILSQESILGDSVHPPFARRPLDFGGRGVPSEPGLDTIGILHYNFEVPKEFAGAPKPLLATGDAPSHSGSRLMLTNSGATLPGPAVAAMSSSLLPAGDRARPSTAAALRAHEFSQSRHYFYDRWLWVQWPWVALANATNASHKARADAMLQQAAAASNLPTLGQRAKALASGLLRSSSAGAATSSEADDAATLNEAFLLGNETGSALITDAHPLSSALGGSSGTDRRPWNTKKIDPLNGKFPRRAAAVSEVRIESRVNSMLDGTYSGKDVEFSSTRLAKLEQAAYAADFDENGAKSKAMPKRMRPDPVLSEATADRFKVPTPFSYSSAKAQRAGTRFPSVEKLLLDKILEKEKAMDKEATEAIDRFGGTYTPRTIKDVIELKNLDDLQANAPNAVDMGYLPAHSSVFAVSLHDGKKADSLARVAKLRKAYNAILGHRNKKEATLLDLKRSVSDRREQDAFMAETIAVGERTMDALEVRVRRMAIELAASDALGDFYAKVNEMGSDRRNPASEAPRLRELEQEVKLCRRQVADLLRKRQALYAEKDHIESVVIRGLKEQRKTCNGLRSAIRRRLAALGEDISVLKESRSSLKDAKGHPIELEYSVASTAKSTSTPPVGSCRASEPEEGVEESRSPESAAEKQSKRMRLMEVAFGVVFDPTSPDGFEAAVLDKLESSKRLSESLREEQRQLEDRVASLKIEDASKRAELHALQVAPAARDLGFGPMTGLAREQRRLEEAIEEAEIRAQAAGRRAELKREAILATKAGVQHVARIVISHEASGKLPVPPPPTSGVYAFKLDEAAVVRSFDDDKVLPLILAACEQQLVVVKEALSVGKQLEDPAEGAPQRRHTAGRLSGKCGASSLLVTDQEDSELLGIRILTKSRNEARVASSVGNERKTKDRVLDEAEAKPSRHAAGARDEAAALKAFLSDALHDTADDQRRANMLGNRKQGSLAPKGLALDDVLFETKGGLSKVSQRAARSSNKSVVDRQGLKESAEGLVTRKKADERRAIKIQEAEERRLVELANAS